jgi:molecular chaperone GrpE (heat shock protein)
MGLNAAFSHAQPDQVVWGQLSAIKKDYASLKARYYNDTAEATADGKSAIFSEVLSLIDDFDRAKVSEGHNRNCAMRPRPTQEGRTCLK